MRVFFCFFLPILLLVACRNKKDDGGFQTDGETPFVQEMNVAILENPKDAKLYAQRGLAYHEMQKLDKAIADLEIAKSLAPNQEQIYNWLSEVYFENEQFEYSTNILIEGIDRFPRIYTFYPKAIEMALIDEDYDLAKNVLGVLAERYGKNQDYYYLEGQIGLNVAANLSDSIKAVSSFNKSLYSAKGEPSLESFYEIGAIEVARGIYPSSLDTVLKYNASDTDALFIKAQYYVDKGEMVKAEQMYKKIVLIDHSHTDALFNLGLLYLENDSVLEAKKNFEIVTKVDPSYTKAYYFMGIAYERLGQKENAIKIYKQLQIIDPDFEEVTQALKKLD